MSGTEWLLWAVIVALTIATQFYKTRADDARLESIDAYRWVDEIIEALSNQDDERAASLVAEQRTRSGDGGS